MSVFKERVIAFVKAVPRGRVVSYGQVAAACGSPRAARQGGGILRALDHNQKVPWWRGINNQGVISIKGNWTATKELQQSLLEKEGIKVKSDFTINMEKYRLK